jgi:anti-sigma B factor antagonist
LLNLIEWTFFWIYDNRKKTGGETLESIRLDTKFREEQGYKILEVEGEIVYTAPQFKDAVNEIINSGQKDLIVDMSQVSYMDSSGFGTLLSATKRLRPEGGTVNLVSVNSAIDRMLRITRLNTVFNIHNSVNEAIDNIQGGKASI